MTVRVFNSKDYPANKITGVAGSLIALLDIILIASGWTKAFAGTNTASYRSGIGSNQKYYFINDAGMTTAGVRNAGLRGYSVMTTATDAGTNPFPTTTQVAQGVTIRKSATLDAVEREWYAVITESLCYLFIATGDNSPALYVPFAFGDFLKYKSQETRNSFVAGSTNDAVAFTNGTFGLISNQNGITGVGAGCFLSGNPNTASVFDTGTGSDVSRQFGFHSDFSKGGLVSFVGGNSNSPISPETRDLRVHHQYIHHNDGTVNTVRGRLPGFYFIINNNYTSTNGNNVIPTYENLFINGVLQVGKSYSLIRTESNAYILIEISDTW